MEKFKLAAGYVIGITEFRGNFLINVPYSYMKWILKQRMASAELKSHIRVLLDNLDLVKEHQRKLSTKIGQRICSQHKFNRRK